MEKDLLSNKKTEEYNAASIEILEGLEPVRKRPGMYIGGTDERALHHLAAEILDNSMDEAVAGHASRIEIELMADYSVIVKDNGRGIPTDPHPKFPNKSALEVILCTLHSGGKFSDKAYETSGGLHGVGASVVNALSDSLIVEVTRNKEIYEQSFIIIIFSYLRSSILNLVPIPTPSAWHKSLISLFVPIFDDAAPKTFNIFPRKGRRA